MMKKFLAIAVLCVAVPGLAAQLQFAPSPVPLDSMFRVVLSGEGAVGGSIRVLNLRSMEFVTLEFQDEDGRWVTDYIHAVRPCVCEAEEAAARLDVELGDVLVAATEAGEGLSATTKVARPERDDGEPVVRLRRLDTEERDFLPVEEMVAGAYALEIVDRSMSVTCAPDYITDVRASLADRELHLTLEEEDATTGRFVTIFQADIRPEQGELVVELMGPDGETVALPLKEGLFFLLFSVEYEDQRVEAAVSPLRVELSEQRISVPVGCSETVEIMKPEEADEYLWYEEGVLVGTEDHLAVGAFAPKEQTQIRVFVRQDIHWGAADFTYRVTPAPTIGFRNAATGEPAGEPWSGREQIEVRLEYACAEEPPQVRVGVLGEDDTPQTLPMSRIDGCTWVSEPFHPRDVGAYTGDVLWALSRHQCISTYATLRIK